MFCTRSHTPLSSLPLKGEGGLIALSLRGRVRVGGSRATILSGSH
jgi:hypothetical protein